MTALELRLRGAGGEPVDLARTLNSHGFAELPPLRLDAEANQLDVTLPMRRGRPRRVRISQGRKGYAQVEALGGSGGSARSADELLEGASSVLRLDRDLSGFYRSAAGDPDLSWVTSGAGRMIRSPTAFEDVVKTVCTTNCSWALTQKMVAALVSELGEPAIGGNGSLTKAFPTADAMAAQPERFYREVVRAGYRSPNMVKLSSLVAAGDVDVEALSRSDPEQVPDDQVESVLLGLPGVGPYAAAHIMMTMGRDSRLIFDSWTRPKYARLTGKKKVADSTITRRFRRYGPHAGLAFWLFLTRDWLD
jgi:3-methyladenine DNA glycosylase/8-oxoguanine DNA glycosylase